VGEGLLPVLLLAQAAIGGTDTLVNHEIIARLPRRPEARREIGLHAVRESIYAALFAGLAFFAWHGAWAWIIAALLAMEVLVTGTDEWIENRTRLLPQNERALHVLLTLNLGAIIAVTLPLLVEWGAQPRGFERVDHGWLSWALLAFGLASLAWSVRDAIAFTRLGEAQ
jgi:hypothetical protein